MAWRVDDEELNDSRPDRPDIGIPWLSVKSMHRDEWKELNPHTMELPVAFIDAETWRDFDRPVFFGAVIVDYDRPAKKHIVGATLTGEKDPKTGKLLFKPNPSRWPWSRCPEHTKSHKKEQLENCPHCERVKPKNYGKMSSQADPDARIRMTSVWCWDDELETHLIPILIERKVRKAYAHNATVDFTALMASLEPQVRHPLELFVQSDPKEWSPILFKGSTILKAELDLAKYWNRVNPSFSEWRYDYKKKKFTKRDDYPFELWDSLGILPLTLAKIGEAVNYPKGKTPDVFINADHPQHGDPFGVDDEAVEYCLLDCEVLWIGVNEYWKTCKALGYHGKTLALTSGTMGSQMIGHYNAEGNQKPKLFTKTESWKYGTIVNNPDLDDICRLSMVGGRTQVFDRKPQKGTIYAIDRNSMYPSEMVEQARRWPDFRNMNGVKVPAELTPEHLENLEGAVFVHWKRPASDRLGLLSARNEANLLDWSLLEGTRWITLPEYRFGLSVGYDFEIMIDEETDYCAVICETLPYNPFTEILGSWYDERLKMKAAKDPREFVLKILLNAGGFGKFVERNQDSIITSEEAWAQMPPEWLFCAVSDDGARTYGYASSENYKRAATTANIMGGYITAYARIHLFEIGTLIGPERLIYCDTDSWYYHAVPGEAIPQEGDGLGCWKLEKVLDFGEFTRPKQYRYRQIWDEKNGDCIKWNARVKGCSLHKAAQEAGLDFEDYCEQLDLGGTVTFERVVGLKESWRRDGVRAGQWIVMEKQIGNKETLE